MCSYYIKIIWIGRLRRWLERNRDLSFDGQLSYRRYRWWRDSVGFDRWWFHLSRGTEPSSYTLHFRAWSRADVDMNSYHYRGLAYWVPWCRTLGLGYVLNQEALLCRYLQTKETQDHPRMLLAPSQCRRYKFNGTLFLSGLVAFWDWGASSQW